MTKAIFSACAAARCASCSSGATGWAIETWATQPLPKKERLPAKGAVDELVDEHEQARIELLLERAAGRNRDDVGDAGPLQRVDIGAVIDAGGRQRMAAPVPGQKHRFRRADPAEAQRVRRLAPGRRDALLANVLKTGQVIDARAADDSDDCFGHAAPPLERRQF